MARPTWAWALPENPAWKAGKTSFSNTDAGRRCTPENWTCHSPVVRSTSTSTWWLMTRGCVGAGVGALTFGVRLPNLKLAYGSSPTWVLYGGDATTCADSVPVLIYQVGAFSKTKIIEKFNSFLYLPSFQLLYLFVAVQRNKWKLWNQHGVSSTLWQMHPSQQPNLDIRNQKKHFLVLQYQITCLESPVCSLSQQDTFCEFFTAEARDFQTYSAWVLSAMLRQADLILHPYPMEAFQVSLLRTSGLVCLPDKPPLSRRRLLTPNAVSNLYKVINYGISWNPLTLDPAHLWSVEIVSCKSWEVTRRNTENPIFCSFGTVAEIGLNPGVRLVIKIFYLLTNR